MDKLAALGLEAVMTPDMGRALVATRAFSPGDVILEEEPLAWALEAAGGSAHGRSVGGLGRDTAVHEGALAGASEGASAAAAAGAVQT